MRSRRALSLLAVPVVALGLLPALTGSSTASTGTTNYPQASSTVYATPEAVSVTFDKEIATGSISVTRVGGTTPDQGCFESQSMTGGTISCVPTGLGTGDYEVSAQVLHLPEELGDADLEGSSDFVFFYRPDISMDVPSSVTNINVEAAPVTTILPSVGTLVISDTSAATPDVELVAASGSETRTLDLSDLADGTLTFVLSATESTNGTTKTATRTTVKKTGAGPVAVTFSPADGGFAPRGTTLAPTVVVVTFDQSLGATSTIDVQNAGSSIAGTGGGAGRQPRQRRFGAHLELHDRQRGTGGPGPHGARLHPSDADGDRHRRALCGGHGDRDRHRRPDPRAARRGARLGVRHRVRRR
jgi:hypothetical protein